MKSESSLVSSTTFYEQFNPTYGTARSFFNSVLLVTALAGTFDILAAHLHIWLITGSFPSRLFKGIAGGMFGRERAMQGGISMIAMGVFFHYFISFAFTLFYFVLFPRLGALRNHRWVAAVGYATFVSIVMGYVVLPLSALRANFPNFGNIQTYIGCVILVFVFGVPVTFGAARYYRGRSSGSPSV